ncbi:MAG: transcriptional regulator MraZ [Proteobacteria bacterium]|nr:MAG: transcriptional regulator MraZ [Pseudomonadota bacterium]
MFRGVNTLNLDAKGRLAIPTRYREPLQEQSNGSLVITVDPDHCLLVYPLPAWIEIERQLMRLPALDPEVRRMQRLLVGHAADCEIDSSGRVLLPPPLREFAKLDKRVVLVGQGNKFELWEESAWNARRETWLADGLGGSELGSGLETLSL